jgi:hypothetical protein
MGPKASTMVTKMATGSQKEEKFQISAILNPKISGKGVSATKSTTK